MPTKKSVDDLRHHRLFVTDYTMENGFSGSEAGEEIRTKLVLDRLLSSVLGTEGRALECAKCFWMDRQRALRGKCRLRDLI